MTVSMTSPALSTVDDLVGRVLLGALGSDPAALRVSVGFATRQGVRHRNREQGYRNEVISLRVDRAVGSAAVEPDEVPDDVVYDCVGATVAELLAHPLLPVRIAALDAYLMSVRPHDGVAVRIPGGDSYQKSLARADAVVDLVAAPGPVLVIGVVNSLLHQLRERGLSYVACDRKGGRTEWGEPVVADAADALDECAGLLVSGMTLANGTFDPLLAHARDTGKPLVMFAQTGSAVLPWFVGAGVTAVSAEPYPFFWLDGEPSVLHHYREARP
jgi:hypothetical protein